MMKIAVNTDSLRNSNTTNQQQQTTVVWEYEGDVPDMWVPYLYKVSNHIEHQYSTQASTCALSPADPLLMQYIVDFHAMIQRNVHTGRTRSIVRSEYTCEEATVARDVGWQWLMKGGWCAYSRPLANALEHAHKNDEQTCDLQLVTPSLANIAILDKGYQENKYTGFMRPIRRVQVHYTKTHNPSSATSPPNPSLSSSSSSSSLLPDISTFCNQVRPSKDDACCICLCDMEDGETVQMKLCAHEFHEQCLQTYHKQSKDSGFLQCPICKQIHGTKRGNQPAGVMKVEKIGDESLPGHEDCCYIQITYHIQSGVQGKEHPRPGESYYAYGFPRVAYLPDNEKGNRVLKLLKIAWERRLVFTVGTSLTTSASDAVIWNDIHHKTSRDHGCYGYPDPQYLDNVTEELRAHGVV